ncbi:MAG: hypothetical protein LBN24_01810 [Mediterranea sp.]|jgi:hypothetical protein|nr:hypothetical protein [Mediterranea sp.]
MKKFLAGAFAISMALATVTLAGCSNDEDLNAASADAGKSVFMKFDVKSMGGVTRGVSSPIASGTELTLTKATIVFYVGADFRVTKTYSVTADGTAGTGTGLGDFSFDQVKTGVTITGLDQATTNVSVVGNTAVNVQVGANWLNYIDGHVINAGTQSSEDKIGLYGKAALQPVTGTTGSNKYQATVSLAPITSRFEIPSVAAGDGLASFTVTGVYMEKFYQTAKLNGNVNVNASDPLTSIKGLTTVAADMASDYSVNSNPLAVNWNGSIFSTDQVGVTGTTATSPATGKVWGFYVFARPYTGTNMFAFNSDVKEDTYGDATTAQYGTQVPRIIIELQDVVPTDPVNASIWAGKTWYATIGGFKYLDPSTNADTQMKSLVGGYVFSTPTDFSLKAGDLHSDPNPGTIDVTLTVSPMKWKTVPVTPILQ